MAIRFTSDRPIYLQFAEHLAAEIIAGMYAPGERLLSVREFAEQYAVNPNTIQRALGELESQALAYAERGSGWYVTQEADAIDRARRVAARRLAENYLAEMKRLGLTREKAMELLNEEGEVNGTVSDV